MKILSITAQKPHSTGSGVYLTEMVSHWQEQGHRQAVVAGIYKEDEVLFPEGVKFYPVCYRSEELPFAIAGMSDEMPYESVRYSEFSEKMLEQYRQAFQKTVRKAVEELKPDVIVCHHIYLLTAMVREWFPDRNIIGISHGSDLRQISKNPLLRDYIKRQIGKLDCIIALHREHGREIRNMIGCEEEKIRVIGIGYNQNIFYREERKKKRYAQLAFAGKVTEKKGIFSLLRAIEQLPYEPEQLVVKMAGGFGTESERKEIERLAAQSRYQICLPGKLPQEQLADMFRQSDVFVLPSFYEGLPLVNVEAMACGCKVVCSDIPGIREWYDEKIPGHRIEFIPLPKMKNTDEPLAGELAEFERRLAEALQRKLEQREEERPVLDEVSWRGISVEILKGEEKCL